MTPLRSRPATWLVAAAALLSLTTLTGPASTAASAAPARLDGDSTPTPLAQAHAHNDYEHDQPLFDALSHGFTSVEADVWLVDGRLLVAHDRDQVKPGRTLSRLYLRPLAERVRQSGGSVYPGWEHTFHLLIDVKSEADSTYRAIDAALGRYQRMLTRFTPGGVQGGAVTATISGNRDLALMESQQVRYAAYDGRLADLGSGAPASLIPLISDNWTKAFTWRGEGPMPADEREKLRSIVSEAHANGQRVRFWATPDSPGPARENIWRAELEAGVDYFNTDHLGDLQQFLLANDPTPSTPLVPWWPPHQHRPAA
jgi:hypothetical protein